MSTLAHNHRWILLDFHLLLLHDEHCKMISDKLVKSQGKILHGCSLHWAPLWEATGAVKACSFNGVRIPITRNQAFSLLKTRLPCQTKALDMNWNGQLAQVTALHLPPSKSYRKWWLSSYQFHTSQKHLWIILNSLFLANDRTKEGNITLVSTVNWLTGAVKWPSSCIR